MLDAYFVLSILVLYVIFQIKQSPKPSQQIKQQIIQKNNTNSTAAQYKKITPAIGVNSIAGVIARSTNLYYV